MQSFLHADAVRCGVYLSSGNGTEWNQNLRWSAVVHIVYCCFVPLELLYSVLHLARLHYVFVVDVRSITASSVSRLMLLTSFSTSFLVKLSIIHINNSYLRVVSVVDFSHCVQYLWQLNSPVYLTHRYDACCLIVFR